MSQPGAPTSPDTPLDSSGIVVENLRRHFGAVRAVDRVSFTAPAGKVTALVGPNGSGKTTLLLVLAGLLHPDAGTVRVAGCDMARHSRRARAVVGWMPDVFGTWDTLTCAEILTVYARAYRMSPDVARARADDLLDQMYLWEMADRPARVLSRGQKQRLGLARALIHDPAVLLLDEPASGMDPRSRIELRQTLRSLADAGKTVLVSSHILSELEEVYDHAVFLSRGRTVDVEVLPEADRRWRLVATDPVALHVFLAGKGIAVHSSAGPEIVVRLASDDQAVALVKDAVTAGVPLHTVAPVTGQLEETYLSLAEERV
ncbi:MAG: ABC transporter ATP-binding protein [Micrococcales bacterium]|nr:ABC transporter ATP-binding protein [Micrococcales bacterium]